MNVCLEVEIPNFRGKSIDYIYSKFITKTWKKKDLERDHYEGLTSSCRTKIEKGLTFSCFDDKFYLLYIFEEEENLDIINVRRKEISELLSKRELQNNKFKITTIQL